MIGPAIESALEKRGFTSLTSIQLAVLDPTLAGRDLRITSQTGSGKTVAVGFVIREVIEGEHASKGAVARPRALVIAPTRELARQFEEELSWLYAEARVRVVSVTGGTSQRDERRTLAQGPAVVVGTPGRLLDHLDRGVIDGSQIQAVVLDEADRLLDMGFREDLEKILSFAKGEHRTHLVSATFPREVRSLADRVQKNAALVEGTRLGAANIDIDHVLHLVASHERLAALVNLLLSRTEEQTLVFARTRADVARIAKELESAGFRVAQLSGEMEQSARNRALAAFKSGHVSAMVATDVAARGIDVQDIARVIHFDPPGDADTYTHRSGRTGRAGKKGTSAVLVPPSALVGTLRLLGGARVTHRFEPVPTAADIRRGQTENFEKELLAEGEDRMDEVTWDLAKRLVASPTASRSVARLISRARKASGPEPREVRPLDPPVHRSRNFDDQPRNFRDQPRNFRDQPRNFEDQPRNFPDQSRTRWSASSSPRPPADFHAESPKAPVQPRLYGGDDLPEKPAPRARASERKIHDTESAPRPRASERKIHDTESAPRPRASERKIDNGDTPIPRARASERTISPALNEARGRAETRVRTPKSPDRTWVPFRISWGGLHGADVRRLLPIVCRRGEIEGGDVGAIRVDRTFSLVEIGSDVADRFAKSAARPDPRDPRIQIERQDGPAMHAPPRRDDRPPPRRDDGPPRRDDRPRVSAPRDEARTRWKKPEGGATPLKRKPKSRD